MDSQGFIALVYSLSAVLLVCFASFAVVYTYLHRGRCRLPSAFAA